MINMYIYVYIDRVDEQISIRPGLVLSPLCQD